MHEEIIIAGFGGQGVILAGKLLCEAAMADRLQVVCSVSYGPEMRGGTANSGVILSDHEIGALVVSRPSIAIVMNGPSLEKFQHTVRPGGLLMVNQSLVRNEAGRADIEVRYIPANDLAEEVGNKDVANIVMLGALLGLRPLVSLDSIRSALEKALAKTRPELLEVDLKALVRGMDFVAKT